MEFGTLKWPKVATLLAGVVQSALSGIVSPAASEAQAPAPAEPNILFVMTDDGGWMTPGIYHQGMMVGETRASTASAATA